MSAIVERQQTLPGVAEVPDAPVSLLQIISRAASDPNVDIEKMERLMAMHERITAKQAEVAFNEAMTACQREIPAVFRNKINEEKSARYADLEQLDKVARPIYTKHGFALSFGTADCAIAGHVRQTCLVSHVGGHSRTYQADIPLDLTGPKGNPNKTGVQGFGSSMSYGQRYMTKLIFNIALTNEDNDGEDEEEYITPQQVADLEALISEVRANKANFLKMCKIDALQEMPARKFKEAVARLEEKRKQP